MKKVTFTAKPAIAAAIHASADDWVENRHRQTEPMKRFTIDVPLSLHQRVKSQCALRSVKMTDVLRELLEKQFPEEYQEKRGGGNELVD
jgi:hypothetical protein